MTALPYRRAGRDLVRAGVLLLLVAIVGVSLPGCATAPAPQLIEVRVPVPIACRVQLPPRPAMPTESLAPGGGPQALPAKVRALLAELELRAGYELELEVALVQCMEPPPAD